MRTGRFLSGVAILAGAGLLAWVASQGQLSVHLIVIVPVISGTGPAAALGMLLVLGGVLGWFWTGAALGPARSPGAERAGFEADRPPEATRAPPAGETAEAEVEQRTRSGGVILIGPIPIAWGSDRESLGWVLVAAIVLTLVAVAAFVYLGR